MNLSVNTVYIFKKCLQQFYLVRRLRSLSVSEEIIEVVYKSLVESVLTFHLLLLLAWYSHLNC